jgi:hypothetical protein
MSDLIIIIARCGTRSESFYKLPQLASPTLPTTTMSYTFARVSRASAPCIQLTRTSRAPASCIRLTRLPPASLRTYSSTPALCQPAIPTVATCPSPTCSCASAPADLDIDRKTPLLNTMAAYSSQVILSTGKTDWHSTIEQDSGATGTFVSGLKSVIGKGSEAFDVCSFPFCLAFNSLLI